MGLTGAQAYTQDAQWSIVCTSLKATRVIRRLALLGLLMPVVSSCVSAIPSQNRVNTSYPYTVTEDAAAKPVLDVQVSSPTSPVDFSFSAFGDAGWASSHVAIPVYRSGFRRAYQQFDPSRRLIGDINFVNWETSVGHRCSAFWAPRSRSSFAFLSHPQDLADASSIGFNLIGLANNHSFDCLRSPEGLGPLQSLSHLSVISSQISSSKNPVLFNGIYASSSGVPSSSIYVVSGGLVPVTFISAYVGGDAVYCKNIICDKDLERLKTQMASASGFRVLALHSWNPKSHSKLKAILSSWIHANLIDVAIGTGPHVAESISIVKTRHGSRILATSLGNFIHPSLSSQENNIVITSKWRFNPVSGSVDLLSLRPVKISCNGSVCTQLKNQVVENAT